MRFRLEILDKNGLKLPDIQRVIGTLDPLEGAVDFTGEVRKRTELIILSDTFTQFAKPLMAKLGYPTLFCNTLIVADNGAITGYKLRQQDGKKHAVIAFKSINLEIFAAGDSFNDLKMIRQADAGCLFRAPESIRQSEKDIPCVDTYPALLEQIDVFLGKSPSSRRFSLSPADA
jgi:phosphoserine/homoserine phosphotransferase